jgi:hypothetical protein
MLQRPIVATDLMRRVYAPTQRGEMIRKAHRWRLCTR